VSQETILVVEDDEAVRRGIVDALQCSGYETLEARDGAEGIEKGLRANYQLMLLDMVMPHRNGLEVLAALKRERAGQPVIILSARGEEADRVRGLQGGADDYVVKPFSVRELLARVEAVLRRSCERVAAVETLCFSGGEMDVAARELRFDDGRRVELSMKELEVVRYLMRAAGRAVSREELLRHVWHLEARGMETRTIDMHIAHLRTKLGDSAQSLIVTVRGKGYRWSVL
jgi:DNA-binding response OmpR family regulator